MRHVVFWLRIVAHVVRERVLGVVCHVCGRRGWPPLYSWLFATTHDGTPRWSCPECWRQGTDDPANF